MKIRDLISEGPFAKAVGQKAKAGWTQGGPITKLDKSVRGSNIANKMSGYADMFNKKHGSAVKAKDPTGILPGQAMDKKGRIPFADPKAKGKADKGAKADPNVQKQLKALAAENAELKKQINQLMIQLKKGGA